MAPDSESTSYRFDASYREEALLGDGMKVVLRLVQPPDRDLLRRGFAQLSPESRYLRFFTEKPSLSEDELARLTDLDGINELGIGAARVSPDGTEQGLGIARFARDPRDPTVAEAAVTVVDQAQGRGLGTLLLERLAEAAMERGIRRFSCEFLASNRRVRGLIEETCPDALLSFHGDLIRAEIPLPGAGNGERSPTRDSPAYRLLRQIARGALVLRLRHLLLKGP
jgi:GNAT superfamily N-acetyltransferase